MTAYGIEVRNAAGSIVMNTDDPLLISRAKGTADLSLLYTATTPSALCTADLTSWGVLWSDVYRAILPVDDPRDLLFVEVLADQRVHVVRRVNANNGQQSYEIWSNQPAVRWITCQFADRLVPRHSGYGVEIRNAAGEVVWADTAHLIAVIGPLTEGAMGSWIFTEGAPLQGSYASGMGGGYFPGAHRDAGGALTPQGWRASTTETTGKAGPDARVRGLVAAFDYDKI